MNWWALVVVAILFLVGGGWLRDLIRDILKLAWKTLVSLCSSQGRRSLWHWLHS